MAATETRAQATERGAVSKRSSREIAATAKRESPKPRLHGWKGDGGPGKPKRIKKLNDLRRAHASQG